MARVIFDSSIKLCPEDFRIAGGSTALEARPLSDKNNSVHAELLPSLRFPLTPFTI